MSTATAGGGRPARNGNVILHVGGAMAERDATIVNTDIGAPLEGLIEQLAVERADTFVWQRADGHLPRGSMVAQRPRTDAAIVAFRAGATAAFGVEPLAVRPVAEELLCELSQIGTLRAEVDVRTISPLAAPAPPSARPPEARPSASTRPGGHPL